MIPFAAADGGQGLQADAEDPTADAGDDSQAVWRGRVLPAWPEHGRTIAEAIRTTTDEDRLEDAVEKFDAGVKLGDAC